MQSLGKVGKGVGTAIGVPLTGLAMVQAARSGRDPLAVLRSAMGEQEPLDQVQKAQLEAQKRQGLLAQLEAATDPRKRAILAARPELAEGLGFPIKEVAVEGAAPAPGPWATGLGAGPTSMVKQVEFPDVPLTAQEQLAQARADREGQVQMILNRELGLGGGVGTVQPVSGSTEPVATPSAGGMGIRGFSLGPGGTSVTIGPDPAIAEAQKADRARIEKGREEVSAQRLRSVGASAFLEDLKGSVNRIYSAKGLGDLPGQAIKLGKMNLEGDEDAVNIATAAGRITVLVEALQKDARVSNQDATFLMKNLPSLYTDTKTRALSKLKKIEDLLAKKNIKLDEELQRLEGGQPGGTSTTTTPGVQGGPPSTTMATVPPAVQSNKATLAGILGGPVARAKGGPVTPMQLALVGEHGPELSVSTSPRQIVPLQQMAMDDRSMKALQALQAQESMVRQQGAMQAPGASSGGGGFQGAAPSAPRQMQMPGQVPTGLSVGGTGLTDADAARAQQGGGTIMLDKNGLPVWVPN